MVRWFILTFLFLLLIHCTAEAQYNAFNQRDDKYPLLGLKRAKEVYESEKAEYERIKQLFEKQLASPADLERAKRSLADVEVNYQQSLLAVLFEQQFITVSRAVKYQDKRGQKRVRIELMNTSGGEAEFRKLIAMEDDLFRSLQPDHINNIYVSLTNTEGAIISQPYESKVNELIYGQPVTLDFAMLQDLDVVSVNIIYGNGASRTMRIFLQKDATENKVLFQSEQFSQEADLGSNATFDLTLELFSGTDNTFKLEVLNLPPELTRYFLDASTNAKLSQLKFTESARTRKASLRVFLPDRPTEQVQIEKTIPFYVLAIPQEKQSLIQTRRDKVWSQQDIETLNAGYLRLELIVKGNARLLVKAPKLYYATTESEPVEASLEIRNDGSRRLDNIKFEVDLPLEWKKDIQPLTIPSVQVNEESVVKFKFYPPENVAVGKYEVRIRTSSVSENQPVNAEDKVITIEVQAGSNVLGTLALIVLILGIIGGIVWFGIKLTRK